MSICRPKLPRCSSSCEQNAVAKCAFELTGKKAGQMCARLVCAEHSKIVGGKRLCLPHVRLITADAVS